ncbi:hypothetical protein [Paenibacillus abyssi]|uniref:Uncharacterized protein n=1 Tax=Paenibacillus abyssi TaxID=1340531 RepID=A0A917CSB6_9BACL|nr:hypothetical protein [Paenibacillus abyssi]GGF97933.1 hypothetical protein GCM10010916_13970 [Paenibacillus abyssi]
MKMNPFMLSISSTIFILAGIVLYWQEMVTLGIPLVVIGLCMSVVSSVIRWRQSKE